MNPSGGTTESPAKTGAALALPSRVQWRDIAIVVAVAWAARFLFMWLVPPGARSFDTFSWQTGAWLLANGKNPYQATTLFNWPPFWMQCVFIISKIAAWLNVPFFRALQGFLILFETAVIIVTVRFVQILAPAANARALVIIGMALNPAAILLTCQHCNFDVIMALWVLLAIACLMRYHASGNLIDWLCACLFLGLGILTKTVPLALVPLLAGGFRKATASVKLLGIAFVLGPVSLGMSVIYVLSPAQVAHNVLGYRASGFIPGFEGLLRLMDCGEFSGCLRLAFYLLGIGIMAMTWRHLWTKHSVDNRELTLYTALVLMLIGGEGMGFAGEYYYWFLPFLVITYAQYPGTWRKLLIGFGIISAISFIVNYGLVPAYGYNFLFLMSRAKEQEDLFNAVAQSHNPFFLRVAGWSSQFGSPGVETLAGMPLFITGIAVLIFGARLLLNSTEGPPKKWVWRLVGFNVVYIVVIFCIALGVKSLSPKKPAPDHSSSSQTNQGQ